MLFVLGHFFLMLLPQADEGYEPIYRATFAFVLFGVAYSLYTTSLWPCVPYVVDKKMLGSAYGIVIAMENIGLSIGPLLVSAMHATSYKGGYFAVSMLNFFEALIGTAFAGYLFYYDYTHSQVLLANSKMATAIQRSEKHKSKTEPRPALAPAQIAL